MFLALEDKEVKGNLTSIRLAVGKPFTGKDPYEHILGGAKAQ